ncbi:NAD(P)-binding domain-containing protein [bacterium]|nr:NAD(P)-binding domain-containing protein [bacterium]
MKVGILGSGDVGKTLAGGFIKHGYEVMAGSRDPQKLEGWKSDVGDTLLTGSFQKTAKFAEIIVVAVKGAVAEDVLKNAGAEHLAGKTVIDATNPISNEAPVNGVLKFYTDINESQMERLQKVFPEANFVKAFSCIGSPFMVNPPFEPTPSMFICGNNEAAKAQVVEVLDKFGWDVEDMGAVEAARAIEPLCMLWCIPGLRNGSWTHAFKLVKLG